MHFRPEYALQYLRRQQQQEDQFPSLQLITMSRGKPQKRRDASIHYHNSPFEATMVAYIVH